MLLLILAASLVVRLTFLWGSPDRHWPHSAAYEGDAGVWVHFAEALRNGRSFEFDLPGYPPAMAYFVRLLFWAAPSNTFLAGKIVLCVLGSVSCVLTWFVARPVAGKRAALIASMMSAASFGLIVQCASLNSETPYTFLLLLIVLLTRRAAERPSFPNGAVLGLLHGAAVLFRAEHLILVVLLMGRQGCHLLIHCVKSLTVWRHGAVLAATLLVTLLPWSIRSHHAIERFNKVPQQEIDYEALGIPWTPDARAYMASLPAFAREANVLVATYLAKQRGADRVDKVFIERWLSSEMGYVPTPLNPYTLVTHRGALAFALANNALADGGFSTRLLDPDQAVRFSFANPRHLRLFQHGYSIGGDYLAGHPRDSARLLCNKLSNFFDGFELGFTTSNFPLGFDGLRRPVDQLTVKPGEWLCWKAALIALGGVGLLLGVSQAGKGAKNSLPPWYQTRRPAPGGDLAIVFLYKLAVTLAFFGYARQAVSILPFFYAYVALALETLVIRPIAARLPLKTIRPIWIAAPLSIVVALACLADLRSPWAYDVRGPADAAPHWGDGAFESHQKLEIRRIFDHGKPANEKSAAPQPHELPTDSRIHTMTP